MKNIKIIRICGKTSDMCHTTFLNADGKKVSETDGYVPDFMPGEHDGDYIILDIDVATGRIVNWTHPTQKELRTYISKIEKESLTKP